MVFPQGNYVKKSIRPQSTVKYVKQISNTSTILSASVNLIASCLCKKANRRRTRYPFFNCICIALVLSISEQIKITQISRVKYRRYKLERETTLFRFLCPSKQKWNKPSFYIDYVMLSSCFALIDLLFEMKRTTC